MKKISLLSKKCVYGQFLADEFIPIFTMVGAVAAGKSLRNGTKALQIMENYLAMMEGHLAIIKGQLTMIEDDLALMKDDLK